MPGELGTDQFLIGAEADLAHELAVWVGDLGVDDLLGDLCGACLEGCVVGHVLGQAFQACLHITQDDADLVGVHLRVSKNARNACGSNARNGSAVWYMTGSSVDGRSVTTVSGVSSSASTTRMSRSCA